MNSMFIEQSLSHMHQEDLRREVRANRSAKRLRAHRGLGSSVWRFPALFSFGAKRAIPERAGS